MVRDHVAQSARLFIVKATLFDTNSFSHRDLNVINIAPVPDWLENAVPETKHHDVLDCFLAQVMIDAIDLPFVQRLRNFTVQSFGGVEIAPEGFLDDDPPPLAILLRA